MQSLIEVYKFFSIFLPLLLLWCVVIQIHVIIITLSVDDCLSTVEQVTEEESVKKGGELS